MFMKKAMMKVPPAERRRSARIIALEERDRLEKEKKKSMEANFNSNGNININRSRIKGKPKHKSLGQLISVSQGIPPPESRYYSSRNGKEVLYSVQRMPEFHVLVFVIDLLQKEFQCTPISDYGSNTEEVEAYYHIKTLGFQTIRAKLREGMYTEFGQFEEDIYSLCRNTFKKFISSHGAQHNPQMMGRFDLFNNKVSLCEYAWRLLSALRTDPEKFKMDYGLISKTQSVRFSNNSGSLDLFPSVPERRNSYKPFSNGKSPMAVDFVAPKTLVTQKNADGVDYREVIERFVQDMGPIPKEMAERKIAQLDEALAEAASYGWRLQPITSVPETSNAAAEREEATTFRSSILEDIERVSRIVREGNTGNGEGVNLVKSDDGEEGGYMNLERYLKGKGICTEQYDEEDDDDDDEDDDIGDDYLSMNDLNDDIQYEQEPTSDHLLEATLEWNPRNWRTYPTYKHEPMEIHTSGMQEVKVLPTMMLGGRKSQQEEGKSSYGMAARPFSLLPQSEGSSQAPASRSVMAAKPEGRRAQGHPLFPAHVGHQGLQGFYHLNEAECSMSLGGNGQYPAMSSFDLNYSQNTTTDCSRDFQALPMEVDSWGQGSFPNQKVQVASSLVRVPGLGGSTEQGQDGNYHRFWGLQLVPTRTGAGAGAGGAAGCGRGGGGGSGGSGGAAGCGRGGGGGSRGSGGAADDPPNLALRL